MSLKTQFYLVSPDKFDLLVFLPQFEAIVKQCGELVGAFLLHERNANIETIEALKPICAHYNIALMVENDIELALQTKIDGIHLHSVDKVKSARLRAGEAFMIGASCGGSRDAAMRAGESGADYVVLENIALIEWWQELFELPCVAENVTQVNAKQLTEAGADFLMVPTEEATSLLSILSVK